MLPSDASRACICLHAFHLSKTLGGVSHLHDQGDRSTRLHAHANYVSLLTYFFIFLCEDLNFLHTYVRSHIHTHMRPHIHTHVHIHMCIQIHTYIQPTPTYIHTHVHTYIHTYTRTHTHIRTYTCIYTHKFLRMMLVGCYMRRDTLYCRQLIHLWTPQVCMSVCMYVHVCMYVCMYVCICVYLYTSVCIHAHVILQAAYSSLDATGMYVCVCVCVCVYVFVHMCMHTCTPCSAGSLFTLLTPHVSVYVCMYAWVCICMKVYTYIRRHTYIHTRQAFVNCFHLTSTTLLAH